jgi:flagellar biosynthesis/type III secretory pathway chaperone
MNELTELLREERQAIATIDLNRLSVIAEKKQTLIEAMQRGPLAASKKELAKLMAEAEANRALIHDAVSTLKEMLGISDGPGTYDARAKMRARASSLVGTKL